MALSTSLQELSLALTQLDSALNVGGQIATTATPVRSMPHSRQGTQLLRTPETVLPTSSVDVIQCGGDTSAKREASQDRTPLESATLVAAQSAPAASEVVIKVSDSSTSVAAVAAPPVTRAVAKSAVKVLHFAPKKTAQKSGGISSTASATAVTVNAHPTPAPPAAQLHSSKIFFANQLERHAYSSVSVDSSHQQLPRSASATVSAVPSKSSDTNAPRFLQCSTASSSAKTRTATTTHGTSSSVYSTGLRSAELLQRIKEELARGDQKSSQQPITLSPLPIAIEHVPQSVSLQSSAERQPEVHVLSVQFQEKSSSSPSRLEETSHPTQQVSALEVTENAGQRQQQTAAVAATVAKKNSFDARSNHLQSSNSNSNPAIKRYPQHDIFNRLYEKGTETHPAPKAVSAAKEKQATAGSTVNPQTWQNILRGRREKGVSAQPSVVSSSSMLVENTAATSFAVGGHKPTSDIWKRLYKQARKQEPALNRPVVNLVHFVAGGDGEETQPPEKTQKLAHDARRPQAAASTHSNVASGAAVQKSHPIVATVNTSVVVQRLYERERDRRNHLEEMRKKKEQEEAEQLLREREEILNKVKKIRELHKAKYYDINNLQKNEGKVSLSISPPPATSTTSPLLQPTGGDVPRRPSTGSVQHLPTRPLSHHAPTSSVSTISVSLGAAAVISEESQENNKSFVLTPSGTWSRNVAVAEPLVESQVSKRLLHSRTSSYVTPLSQQEDLSFAQQNAMLVPHLDFSKIRR